MTTPKLLFSGFGQATIAASDGSSVTLHADFPAAPGRPLEGVLETERKSVSIKVRGSHRLAPQLYAIEGRFVSLTRELREFVLAALAASTPSVPEVSEKMPAPPNSPETAEPGPRSGPS